MIRVENVTMRFGGILAVDGCSLDFADGRITGLIGPNGAGKSTLFDIVAGGLRPSAGRVLLDGADITDVPAFGRYRLGLHRTFQIAREFRRLTVRDNLMVAASGQSGERLLMSILSPGRVRSEERSWRERAAEVMRFLRLDRLADEPAGNLSGGQKKLLELGRALMTEARIILLDEIGAGVNPALLAEIADHIRVSTWSGA